MNHNMIEPLLNNFDKINHNYSQIENDELSDYYISMDDEIIYHSKSLKNKKKVSKPKVLIYKFNLNDRGKQVKQIII